MGLDVSLVLNVHRERALLPRTLASLAEAASFARAGGLSVELIVILDRPDDETRDALASSRLSSFDEIEIAEIDAGSLGVARNEGCARAHGAFLMLCDGDDLISFNGIEATYRLARSCVRDTVLFPKWSIGFGASYFFAEFPDLSVVSPLAFLSAHPYTSRACFRREVVTEIKFQDLPVSAGYAYEDWLFNCELAARGFDFRAVDDVILFYRQTADGLMSQIATRSVKCIPPSALFAPETYLRICAGDFERRHNLRDSLHERQGRSFFSTSVYGHLSYAAYRIEPGLDLAAIETSWETRIDQLDVSAGIFYFHVCGLFRDRRTQCLILLPEGMTPAQIDIVDEISRIVGAPNVMALQLAGSDAAKPAWRGDIELISFPPDEAFDSNVQAKIAIKIIQSCCSEADLHIFPSPHTLTFIETYGRLFPANRKILYLDSEGYDENGRLFRRIDRHSAFLSFNGGPIDLFVAPSLTETHALTEHLGRQQQTKLLRPLCRPARSRDDAIANAARPGNRVLCPSGGLVGYRADLVPRLASLLAERAPGLVLEVVNGPADESTGAACLCLVHLCWLDNCAPDILKGAGTGVPNIAPDAGGVGEFVDDGETGLLVDTIYSDDEAAEAYATAIVRLASDAMLRTKIARGAHEKLENAYGKEAYRQAMMRIVDPRHATPN